MIRLYLLKKFKRNLLVFLKKYFYLLTNFIQFFSKIYKKNTVFILYNIGYIISIYIFLKINKY
ncbi:hypothetical protein DEO29_00100 [Buchnera aphidicola (Schizaphis graminum)]|nr:hypothetical protein DEO29_00100 [Buchnera aphidicola (Schizaphis graminum)]